MPIIARNNPQSFNPAPEGLHHAVCCDVVDLGDVETSFGKKHMVNIVWQTEEVDQETKKRFLVSRRYNLSLNDKATLRRDLESWRGKKFTADELNGFDVENLLGANCQIQVTHQAGEDGRLWARVSAVVPPPKGSGKLTPTDYTRKVDRDATSATQPQEDEVPF